MKEKNLLKIQPLLTKVLRVQAIRSKQLRDIYNDCYQFKLLIVRCPMIWSGSSQLTLTVCFLWNQARKLYYHHCLWDDFPRLSERLSKSICWSWLWTKHNATTAEKGIQAPAEHIIHSCACIVVDILVSLVDSWCDGSPQNMVSTVASRAAWCSAYRYWNNTGRTLRPIKAASGPLSWKFLGWNCWQGPCKKQPWTPDWCIW